MEIVRFDVKSERKRRLVDAELTSVLDPILIMTAFNTRLLAKTRPTFTGVPTTTGGRTGGAAWA